jgi:hypothetical protein
MFELSQIYANFIASYYAGAAIGYFAVLMHFIALIIAMMWLMHLVMVLANRSTNRLSNLWRNLSFILIILATIYVAVSMFGGLYLHANSFKQCAQAKTEMFNTDDDFFLVICKTRTNANDEWSEWNVVDVQLTASPYLETVDSF